MRLGRWMVAVLAGAAAAVTALAGPAAGNPTPIAPPTPSVSPSTPMCPPLAPPFVSVADTGVDSLTFLYRIPAQPVGCPTGRIVVRVYASFEDARMMGTAVGEASSPVDQTSGLLTVTGLRGVYWYRAFGGSAFASLPAGPVATRSDVVACTASATVVNDWGSGFVARVTVTSRSNRQLRGWVVSWAGADARAIDGVWDAVPVRHAGPASAAAANASYNGALAPGASTSFGFVARSDTPGSSLAVTGCHALG